MPAGASFPCVCAISLSPLLSLLCLLMSIWTGVDGILLAISILHYPLCIPSAFIPAPFLFSLPFDCSCRDVYTYLMIIERRGV
ncbi:uncharacterized protein BDV17DRAFT_265261 [Aspergillus undulatus]|uniref:uncharacterized protein n=1 Tax=Aspergillus undulatus TaxID=1810928 RepID=UPI003CCE416C